MSQLLRLYGAHELGLDGYPLLWHQGPEVEPMMGGATMAPPDPSIKDWVRELAGHRCVRCGHPYPPGIALEHPKGEWTPCDEHCTHLGPVRWTGPSQRIAQWRILTVHHLSGDKADCRWWNLAALCQRCHLTIQGRVQLNRLYVHPHSEWFKPYAAGYYAFAYLGEELSRDQAVARLDDLLNLELDPSYRA